jgi:hypothetical protein
MHDFFESFFSNKDDVIETRKVFDCEMEWTFILFFKMVATFQHRKEGKRIYVFT